MVVVPKLSTTAALEAVPVHTIIGNPGAYVGAAATSLA